MIPQFGHPHERPKVCGGQNTEVSNAYANSCEYPVKESVCLVENPKPKGFQTAAALREDRFCTMAIGVNTQQLDDALGRILPIGIHYDHGVTFRRRLNVRKPSCDGTLVAQISSQTQYTYRPHSTIGSLEISRIALFNRTIIDEQNVHCATLATDSLVNPSNEFRCGLPIIPERHEDHNARRMGHSKGLIATNPVSRAIHDSQGRTSIALCN